MNRIGNISKKPYIISSQKPVSSLKTIFDQNVSVQAVVVVDDDNPVGLAMKLHLNDKLSQRYGFSLFINKPITAIMDKSPMMVNHDERIEDVSDKAMGRNNNQLYDHIIVLNNGLLYGVVAVRTILKHLVKFQRERSDILERYASKLEQDDTDKRAMIQELKEAKQMLELVIDTIPPAAFWKDRNSVDLGCNKKFASDAGIKNTSSDLSFGI